MRWVKVLYAVNYSLLNHDGLVLWYKGLHDAPANEIGHGADAEDNHIGRGLAVETKEGEGVALLGCPGEELTRAFVDGE